MCVTLNTVKKNCLTNNLHYDVCLVKIMCYCRTMNTWRAFSCLELATDAQRHLNEGQLKKSLLHAAWFLAEAKKILSGE